MTRTVELSEAVATGGNGVPASNRRYASVMTSEIDAGENPRKAGDKVADAELRTSIARLGILEPLLVVRQEGTQPYRLIAGSRRLAAAQALELEKVPALIQDEAEAVLEAEMQFAENEFRAGLAPLDQAAQIQAFLDRGQSRKEIAAALGKPEAWLAKMHRLRELIEPAKKMLAAGHLTVGHAFLLSRVKPEIQATALKELVRQDADAESAKTKTMGSVTELNRWLTRRYLDLEQAPFDVTDAALVPKAGACLTCPKRTGTDPQLFEDVKSKSLCTDAQCFDGKVKAHIAARTKALEQAGTPAVLVSSAYGYGRPGSLPTREQYVIVKKGECAAAELAIVGAADSAYDVVLGKELLICRAKDCKTHRGGREGGGAGRATKPQKLSPQERVAREKSALEVEYTRAVWMATIEATSKLDEDDLRRVAVGYFDDVWHEFQKDVLKAFGWLPEKGKRGPSSEGHRYAKVLEAKLADAPRGTVARVLMALTTVKESRRDPQTSTVSRGLLAMAKARKVDVRAIRTGLEKALAEKRERTKSKTKPKTTAKTKPKR